jgi:hypothetical protein
MARPSFNNIGLRRDLNLADVSDPAQALNNLLNNLVVTNEGEVFTGGDLDAIKGISNSTVTSGDIALMAGLAVKNAYLDEETSEIVEEVAQPIITVKNQLDTITATTSDPPFFNGGDGLFAEFYEVNQINSNLNINSRGRDVVTGSPVVRKKYWTTGLFEFSNKLDDTLGGANGAIIWEGWYIPDSSGTSTITIQSSGFVILEVASDQDVYQITKNIYKLNRTVFTRAATINSTVISVTQQEAKTVPINDKVVAAFDDNGNPVLADEIASGLYVDGVGTSTITFNQPISIGADYRFDFSLEDNIGGEAYRFSIALTSLERYIPRRIRFTLWWPEEDGGTVNYFNKLFDANLSTRQRPSSGSFPFWYLYSEIGEINSDESFKGFYDKRLLLGGGVIGPENPLNSTQYNKFLSVAPLSMRYSPPMIYSDILRGVYRYTTIAGSEVISVSNTSPYTDNLEIGNKIFATSLTNGAAEVIEIAKNNIVIADNNAASDATLDMTFIDHRGFVKSDFVTSTADVVSINSNSGIRLGDVVVTQTYSGSVYIRVTQLIGSSQFRTSVNLGISSIQRIYIYRDVGLSNQSLDNYCIGVSGKEVAATSAPGSFYITLNNVTGIGVGNVIQSSPYLQTVVSGNPSTLTIVTEINPAGYPANTVRINKAILGTDDMVPGITVVICPSNTTQNKEACVIPLNTAPPFIGTEVGLRTTEGLGAIVGIEQTTAGATLRVLSFTVQSADNIVLLPAGVTQTFDRTYPIKAAGQSFKILGTTNGS